MSKGYSENVDEYAYDYLYEMYKKYCPNGKLSDECPSLKGTPDGDIDIISREGAKWWDAIIYSKRCIEKVELFEKLTPGNPVWFYTYDDELHEGWVDFIECNQREGWTVSMHYKPANKTGSVYTARLWKYSLEEYGKRFACTKEELENE